MPTPCKPLARIAAYDVMTCGYLVVIALLATLFAERIDQWWWYPLTHGVVIGAILLFLCAIPAQPSGWILFIRCWYPAFFIPPIFRELAALVHAINPVDVDPQLIVLDFALFGGHPTVWLEQFMTPWLKEYLQLAYVTFYFLPFWLAAPLYRQRRLHDFRLALCALLLCYYGPYLLYFLTPARGPRFYLAAQQTIPLSGLWLTDMLQNTLDALEGIQRDAFPSGHTALAIVVLVLAAKYRRRQFYPLLVVVMSLVVSTVYLRYHYVVDVLAGIALAAGNLGFTFWLYRHKVPVSPGEAWVSSPAVETAAEPPS